VEWCILHEVGKGLLEIRSGSGLEQVRDRSKQRMHNSRETDTDFTVELLLCIDEVLAEMHDQVRVLAHECFKAILGTGDVVEEPVKLFD